MESPSPHASRSLGAPAFWISVLALAVVCQPLMAEIRVETDFPGGSAEVLEIDQLSQYIQLDPTDHPGRGWRCWWYLRLRGLTPAKPLTLDVGEAPWATPNQASYSNDGGKSWQQTAPGKRAGKRIRYTIAPRGDSMLVAWGPPFVPDDASALVNRLANDSPHASSFSLVTTREQRSTPALRVARGPLGERPLVWIQARQHAWESGASWVCRGFAEWLVSDDDDAVALRERAEVVVVPIMDIDNVARGAGGKSQRPQDHNRDWSERPHWRAVGAAQREIGSAAKAGRLAAFVDLHNPSASDLHPYFYTPPKDQLSQQGRKNLERFLDLAKREMNGPLAFKGRSIESGPKYDAKMWQFISKNWVARLGTSAVSVTLETAWNTPASNTAGYQTVGRQLGRTLSAYLRNDAP